MGLDETGPYCKQVSSGNRVSHSVFSDDAKTSRSPRGIRGYSLLPAGRFGEWKVQGRSGGYKRSAVR